jgi:hypothetical protein
MHLQFTFFLQRQHINNLLFTYYLYRCDLSLVPYYSPILLKLFFSPFTLPVSVVILPIIIFLFDPYLLCFIPAFFTSTSVAIILHFFLVLWVTQDLPCTDTQKSTSSGIWHCVIGLLIAQHLKTA